MVRHGEIEPEKRDNQADEPFCLPQCQTEDCAHGQRRHDRQSRIMRLAARCGAGFRPPRRDRLVCEPHRQTAPPSQGRVIFWSVRDPIARFWDRMTVLGVVFERHCGVSGCLRGSSLRRSSPGRQPQPIRATTSGKTLFLKFYVITSRPKPVSMSNSLTMTQDYYQILLRNPLN
jgi:hypothetical protein